MYKQKIEKDLKSIVRDLDLPALTAVRQAGKQGFVTHDIVCSIPDNPKFGDYTTNIALQLSKQKSKKSYQTPAEIANEILKKFGHPQYLERIEIAGAGFINFFLKNEALVAILKAKPGTSPEILRFAQNDKKVVQNNKIGKRILVEYASPNTHKVFHIGHLRNIITGEAISRLLQFQGNELFRVTYTSDIGPAVAKAVWGVLKLDKEFNTAKKASLREKAEFLGKAYAMGAKAYEGDLKSKDEIDAINRGIYKKDPQFVPLWEETKKWSAAYFDSIYSRMGTEFDAYVWESKVEEEGKKTVEQNLDKVFFKDEGAVIFPGEKYGLHNRVFINSVGNPTYEAKEIGVTFKEESLFPFDLAIHVVANEQSEYFKVVIKAIEQVESRMAGRKKHLPYGFVNLTTGKMSSRLGNVVGAEELIDSVKEAIQQGFPNAQNDVRSHTIMGNIEKIAIGAVKFSFLKYSLNSDIAFDIKQSISLQGDSGPYLMYAYARINSLLEKADSEVLRKTQKTSKSDNLKLRNSGAQSYLQKQNTSNLDSRMNASKRTCPACGIPCCLQQGGVHSRSFELEPEEREVLRLLEYFEFMAKETASKYQPNKLAEYLLSLAKAFNLFYEKYTILYSEKEPFRLALCVRVGEALKLGLYLLGIETVEKM
ncbi:arginine--tRNA ligase [Candidatus Daviesbacteria bacterium]|nr:arginine--tRNA ligase [Candidatus Daviesbacteria bacterium]